MSAERRNGPGASLGLGPLRVLRNAWRGLELPLGVREAAAPLIRHTIGAYVDHVHRKVIRSAPRADYSAPRPGPVVLAGFFSKLHGIGVAGRQTAAALREAGVPFIEHDLAALDGLSPFDHLAFPGGAQGGVFLAHCNPPEYARALAHYGKGALDRWYRIGYWAWEEARLPHDWAQLAPHFHELWAPSSFVAEAIRRSLPAPHPRIEVIPHPLLLVEAEADRPRFGIPQSAFAVLVAFDFRSTRARKNPDAAIEAYCMAFPAPGSQAALVIKTIGRGYDRAGADALRHKIGGRADVIWIEEELSPEDMARLLHSVDAVLSLHRSEGFGLLLAEAMAFGKVVVATGWSGCTDFLVEGAAAPIQYQLAPVRDPSGRYGRQGASEWAEPDISHAAQWLKRLSADRDLRRRLGEAAKLAIAQSRARLFEHLASAPWRALLHRERRPEGGAS